MKDNLPPGSSVDDVTWCLQEIVGFVEKQRFDAETDGVEQPFAAALLARAVLLTRSASALVGGPNEGGSGTLLRVAIECWVDCCYVMYGKLPAALDIFADGLKRREFLQGRWLPDTRLPYLAEARSMMAGIVEHAIAAEVVPSAYSPNESLSVETRLKRAIEAKGAVAEFINVYEVLYRGLSACEVHSSVAIDAHLSADSDERIRVHVAPALIFPAANLVRLATLLCVGAARDLYTERGADATELGSRAQVVATQLSVEINRVDEYIDQVEDEDVRTALRQGLQQMTTESPTKPAQP